MAFDRKAGFLDIIMVKKEIKLCFNIIYHYYPQAWREYSRVKQELSNMYY